jgi:HEAT repeat protein
MGSRPGPGGPPTGMAPGPQGISSPGGPGGGIGPQRFNFTIAPKATVKDLLPTVPSGKPQKPSAFVESLAQVPEVMLTDPLPRNPESDHSLKLIAHQIAKINHINKEKQDRFMEALLASRPDLANLPFQLGDSCRQTAVRSRHFQRASAQARAAIQNAAEDGRAMLHDFLQACLTEDEQFRNARIKLADDAEPTRIAAMMQICSPASEGLKLAMTKYLTMVSHPESSKALAKVILFSEEDEVRAAAIAALKARRDKDYSDVLLQGFRYPWPAVAKRAAEALVKLDRKDLVPQLIDVLDEPDPRAPVAKKVGGKDVRVVRELVRINHHRNCLMCHPPGGDIAGSQDVLTAEVPDPSQSLPSLSEGGYGNQGIPDNLVRIDVTYLRQDFSAMLAVKDAAPWPLMQRFDFVARTRTLADDELKDYGAKFDNLEQGVLPPNHKAALSALRELTGRDTTPTADAWRQLLKPASR